MIFNDIIVLHNVNTISKQSVAPWHKIILSIVLLFSIELHRHFLICLFTFTFRISALKDIDSFLLIFRFFFNFLCIYFSCRWFCCSPDVAPQSLSFFLFFFLSWHLLEHKAAASFIYSFIYLYGNIVGPDECTAVTLEKIKHNHVVLPLVLIAVCK